MLRIFIMALVAVPAIAQTPTVRMINVSRPASNGFEVGDNFNITVTGAPNQPISVRTTMQGRTDWSPPIASTDMSGRWSTTGSFTKADFGDWNELWTVGGKLANPALYFSVGAKCSKGGQGFYEQTGLHATLICGTPVGNPAGSAAGNESYATPSDTDSFRTPDGRVVPARTHSDRTPEQYHAEIVESLVTGAAKNAKSGQRGDQAGALITKIIGTNALTDAETTNVLWIVRAAFAKPADIPASERNPYQTLTLLRNLADATDQQSLKQQIADTATFIQTQ